MRRVVIVMFVVGTLCVGAAPQAGARVARTAALPAIPGACITKNYTDPSGDAVFDTLTYQLQYSCEFTEWRLDATLGPVADWHTFGSFELSLDTDANALDGCDGNDWLIRGTLDPAQDYAAVTTTYRTKSCSSSTLVPGADSFFSVIGNDVEIYFTQSDLGDPSSLRWSASISNQADSSVDFLPDGGSISATGFPTRSDSFYESDRFGVVKELGPLTTHGDLRGYALASPIVGMAREPDGNGYWLLGGDGGIFTFGSARFYGSTGGLHLNRPVVGMAATPSGHGYWFVASDGGIFSYGDAHFYGSTGALHLNQPIVGMSATPSGHGYWLVASDGGIFSYGDAHFYGSTGAIHLNQPIVGMTATPSGHGYWFVARDGGIFSYGDAHFYGSTAPLHLASPVVAMRATHSGAGYHVISASGAANDFGDARPEVSDLGQSPLEPPVVAVG